MDFLIDPVLVIKQWLETLLFNFGLAEGVVAFILTLVGVVVVASFGLLLVILLIWIERKVAARFQDRFGPNRVGPYGLLQTVADIIKLFTKEDTTPDGADKPVFNLAPILALVSVLLMWAVIPFANAWFGTDLNVGVLYIVAVGSIGVLAQLPNFNRLLKKHDIDYEQVTAGDYKRTLTLFGENTDADRRKFTEEIRDTHALFKEFVKANRPAVDIDAIATGEHWYGARALALNLVDELRTSDDYLSASAATADIYSVSFERKKPTIERLFTSARSALENLFMA